MRPLSRRANRARVWQECPPLIEGAGNAGRLVRPQPRVVVENTRVSHHGHTGNTRHSPRNGFNGFLRALPGDRAFLSPSSLRSLLLKNLNASVGASGPHDFAVRNTPFVRAKNYAATHYVHRIPHPTSVTIAKRPSDRDGMC